MQQGGGNVLFHHTQGNAHACSHLALRQAFETVQDQGLTPPGRQPFQRTSQLLQPLLLIETLQRARLRCGGICNHIQWFGLPLALLPTPVITQQIAGDMEKESTRLFNPVAITPPQPLGERVLSQISCIGLTFQTLAKETGQLCMDTAVNGREGAVKLFIHERYRRARRNKLPARGPLTAEGARRRHLMIINII